MSSNPALLYAIETVVAAHAGYLLELEYTKPFTPPFITVLIRAFTVICVAVAEVNFGFGYWGAITALDPLFE
jgi:hypothetical protein